jgi:hypothetical protein
MAFNKANHPLFQQAIDAIRPGVRVPDRKRIAGPLLEAEYRLCEKLLLQAFLDNENPVCLSSDGWSTHDNIALINYMAILDTEDGKKAFIVDGKFSGAKKTAR